MIIHRSLFFILLIGAEVFAEEGVVFEGKEGTPRGWGFQGELWSNSSVVKVSPEIRSAAVKGVSKSMSICGYTVHHDAVSFFPFIVLLVNQDRGLAQVRLKAKVSLESLRSVYSFQIEAYDCDVLPHFSERKFVVVEVKTDVKPIFKQLSYHFFVKVRSPRGSKVGTITAYERPERSKLGICKYRIVSRSAVPFKINEYGTLTTKTLTMDTTKSKKYIFEVEASDCQKPAPRTSLVPVMVDVFDDCQPHWTGLPSTVDYDGEQGVQPIVLNNEVKPSLHLCSENCQALSNIITVKLQGKGIRAANKDLCKQDQHSLKRQEDLCDISKKGVDMLDMASEFMKDGSDGGFYFNANTAIKVNSNSYNFGHFLSRKFTVMFWMKHGTMEVNHLKEQILCNSDGQEHNRHHFSLFLHNCKLILLFRREFGETSQSQYEPTEWRYGPLKEVCDDKWHHYALLFNEGELFVQIDGEMTKSHSQHLEDKPLLPSIPGKNITKLTVGACFHSKVNKFVQYFKGHLVSLKVVDGHLEDINNIRCIATCGEALLLPHIMDLVDYQSSVTILSDSIVIRSHDIFSLLKMFSSISYINTEILSEVHGGQVLTRNVTIDADIKCDGTSLLKLQTRSIILRLKNTGNKKGLKSSSLRILIHDVVQGYRNERIPLFPNLKFIRDEKIVQNIKSCIVRPLGKVIQSWEYIDWPIPSVINFHLTGLNNSHGLAIDGVQLIRVYEAILANLYYVTSKYEVTEPQRKFAIACSYLEKSVTKEVIVKVELKQNDLKTYYIVDDPNQNQKDDTDVLHQQGKESKIGFEEKETESLPKVVKKSVVGNVALWVILVCLMLIVAASIVGFVIFYRRSKRENSRQLPHMTLLKMIKRPRSTKIEVITNPLHNEGVLHEGRDMEEEHNINNDVPDSEEEYMDEGEDYEEEEEEYREKMINNVFPRIPPASVPHSVNV